MKLLVLVRHGESEHNVILTETGQMPSRNGKVQDPPLTALGDKQAFRLATELMYRLSHLDIRVEVSPMLRAMQTAAPFSLIKHVRTIMHIRADLCEKGGLRCSDEEASEYLSNFSDNVRQKVFPTDEAYFKTDFEEGKMWYNAKEHGSETEEIVRQRAAKLLASWKRDMKDGTATVVFTHSVLMSCILGVCLGTNVAFHNSNCSVTVLRFSGDGDNEKTEVLCQNYSLLPEEMQSGMQF
jgi:broad specificity phosphatase PhoE